jgi:hypothetical protein
MNLIRSEGWAEYISVNGRSLTKVADERSAGVDFEVLTFRVVPVAETLLSERTLEMA